MLPQHASVTGGLASWYSSTVRRPRGASVHAKSTEQSTAQGKKPVDAVECVGEGQAVVCKRTTDEGVNLTKEGRVSQQKQTQVELVKPLFSDLADVGSLLLLISPFFFWGTAMVAMKVAAPHSTPLFTASVRLIPAGAIVVAWALANGKPSPNTVAAWTACLLFGLVDGTLFQGFLAEGLQRVPAGVGSVIIDSQPLTVAVVAAVVFGESLTVTGVLGLLVGIAGLLLLEVPPESLQSLFSFNFGEVSSGGPWWNNGQLLMLAAAQCMAAGTLMVPVITKYVDPVMATGWHMLIGGMPLLGLSLVSEPQLASNLSQATPGDIGALAYTSLLGSAASYAVFFYYASKGNLAKLSSLTFLTPIFASVAGFAVLNETLDSVQLGGAALTVVGILLMNSQSNKKTD